MRCIEANLYGHIACVQRHAAMTVRDEVAFLPVDSGLPSDTFNKVARARFAAELAREEIGRAAERETGMCLTLRELWEPPLTAGLAVERAASQAVLEALSAVLAANWQPPDPAVLPFYQAAAPLLLDPQGALRCFVGTLDGEPAAVSSLYLEGGVGGIYSVATRREFRGHGLGSRLACAAADEARRAGARLAVLQSSEEGQRIYRRLGFEQCCFFAEYTLPDRAAPPGGPAPQAA